jgi:hypothetical protein
MSACIWRPLHKQRFGVRGVFTKERIGVGEAAHSQTYQAMVSEDCKLVVQFRRATET